MRRRRRRAPVLWLPNTGTTVNDRQGGDVPSSPSSIETIISTAGVGTGIQTVEIPLFADSDPEATQAALALNFTQVQQLGLSNTEKLGYRLRRLIGKFFLTSTRINTQADCAPAQLVELGIIVRRTDPETGGSLQGAAGSDVGTIQNNRDPWIWRAYQLLTVTNAPTPPNSTLTAVENELLGSFTTLTFDAGGTKDGPKFDIKTNRVIGPEERVFLNVTWTELPYRRVANLAGNVANYLMFCYRGLGSTMSFKGNRRNATR